MTKGLVKTPDTGTNIKEAKDESHLLFDSNYWDNMENVFDCYLGNHRYLQGWVVEGERFFYKEGHIREADVLFYKDKDKHEQLIPFREMVVYAVQEIHIYNRNEVKVFFRHMKTGEKYFLPYDYSSSYYQHLEDGEFVRDDIYAYPLKGIEDQVIDKNHIQYYNKRKITLYNLLADDTW